MKQIRDGQRLPTTYRVHIVEVDWRARHIRETAENGVNNNESDAAVLTRCNTTTLAHCVLR